MNSSFSASTPGLQTAWDSTSLGEFKLCPRKYQLSIIEGWQSRQQSVHLTFGLQYHAALEKYDHAKAEGAEHSDAQLAALRSVLVSAHDWQSDDKYKNRHTLLRSVMWYLDQFADDPLETLRLANGRPAVELSFRMETDLETTAGEKILLCGHLDRVAKLGAFGHTYIVDRKTTKGQLGNRYFDQYTPDNQFSLYALAGKMVFGLPVEGLVVDAAQVGIEFTRFQRGFITRTPAQLDEWYSDLGIWIQLAERYALAQHWPMNDKACNIYSSFDKESGTHTGGCSYRSICAKAPSVRREWLEAEFVRRQWDPLQVRGDV